MIKSFIFVLQITNSMGLDNLTIIGTSHIAQQSINEIERAITNREPDIIALELDNKRFYALIHKQKSRGLPSILKIGIKGFLFSIIGRWVQKKLGKQVGVEPGEEMLTAIKRAKKSKIKIALIDQDIEITLRRFSQALSWKEKFRILLDLIKGFLFKEDDVKKLGLDKIDLSKVPSKKLIKKLMKEVKIRYPNIYKVLVEERNIVMANNISNIMQQNPDKKVLAVVGAGHEDALLDLIKKNKDSINYSFSIAI